MIKLNTIVKLTCRKDGKIKWQTELPNQITNVGLAHVAKIISESDSLFTYLAVGESTVAPASSQTALSNEITTGGLARATATLSVETTNVANDTRVLTKTWTATADHTVGEIGIFNNSSGGIMLGRRIEDPTKAVLNGEELEGEYKIIFEPEA